MKNKKEVIDVGDETIRETKTIRSFNRNQLSDFLKNLASEILNGKIEIRGKEIEIPEQLEVEYELKGKKSQNKLKIEIKW